MTTLALTILFWSVLVFAILQKHGVHMAMTVALAFSDNGHCRPWPAGRWPNLTRLWAPVPARKRSMQQHLYFLGIGGTLMGVWRFGQDLGHTVGSDGDLSANVGSTGCCQHYCSRWV